VALATATAAAAAVAVADVFTGGVEMRKKLEENLRQGYFGARAASYVAQSMALKAYNIVSSANHH
jgi:hypothetical protein